MSAQSGRSAEATNGSDRAEQHGQEHIFVGNPIVRCSTNSAGGSLCSSLHRSLEVPAGLRRPKSLDTLETTMKYVLLGTP